MRFEPDCVRCVLLDIEDRTVNAHMNVVYSKFGTFSGILGAYSYDEIDYHLRQCAQRGLVNGYRHGMDVHTALVRDLTPAGHEFLAAVRTASVWDEVRREFAKSPVQTMSSLIQCVVACAAFVCQFL